MFILVTHKAEDGKLESIYINLNQVQLIGPTDGGCVVEYVDGKCSLITETMDQLSRMLSNS